MSWYSNDNRANINRDMGQSQNGSNQNSSQQTYEGYMNGSPNGASIDNNVGSYQEQYQYQYQYPIQQPQLQFRPHHLTQIEAGLQSPSQHYHDPNQLQEIYIQNNHQIVPPISYDGLQQIQEVQQMQQVQQLQQSQPLQQLQQLQQSQPLQYQFQPPYQQVTFQNVVTNEQNQGIPPSFNQIVVNPGSGVTPPLADLSIQNQSFNSFQERSIVKQEDEPIDRLVQKPLQQSLDKAPDTTVHRPTDFVEAFKMTPLVSILSSSMTSDRLHSPTVSQYHSLKLPKGFVNITSNTHLDIANKVKNNLVKSGNLSGNDISKLNLSPLAKNVFESLINHEGPPPSSITGTSDDDVALVGANNHTQPVPTITTTQLSKSTPLPRPVSSKLQPTNYSTPLRTPSKSDKLERVQKFFISITNTIKAGTVHSQDHPAITRNYIENASYPYGYGSTYDTLTLKTIDLLGKSVKGYLLAEWLENNISDEKMKKFYSVLQQSFIYIKDDIELVPENDNKSTVLVDEGRVIVNPKLLSAIDKGLKCANLLMNFYILRFKNPKYSPEAPLMQMAIFIKDLSINFILKLSDVSNNSTIHQYKPALESIHKELRQLFQSINLFLKFNIIPESSVITIEDISSKFYFIEVENKIKGHDGVFRDSSIDSMRKICMELILTIFTKYPNERTNILDKMLQSYSHVSDKSIRTKNGDHGQLQRPSAMFMRMVHISGLTLGYEASDALDDKMNRLFNNCKESTMQSRKTAHYIVQFLLKKVLPDKGDPKPQKEEPYRELFKQLTADLATSLGHSSWPAAEVLLNIILLELKKYTEVDQVYASNFAFDIIGSISSYLYSIKIVGEELIEKEGESERISIVTPPINVSPVQLKNILNDMQVVLNFERNNSPNDSDPDSDSDSYSYLSSWFLWEVLTLYNNHESSDEIKSICKEFVDNCQSNGKLGNIILIPTNNNSNDHTISYKRLLTLCPIALYYDSIVKIVMKTIVNCKKTKIRTKAFSVLKVLRKENDQILSNPEILLSVQRFLSENEPTSVRDAALDVFGEHIIRNLSQVKDRYKTLCQLCNDPTAGISIKKRAIEYCNELLTRTDDDKIKVDIICCFCKGLKDDDQSIIDIMMVNLSKHLLPLDLGRPNDLLHINFLMLFCQDNFTRECLNLAIEKLLGIGAQKSSHMIQSSKTIVNTLFERESQNQLNAVSNGKPYDSIVLDIIGMFITADGTLISSDQLSRCLDLLNKTNSLQLSANSTSNILIILRYGLAKKDVMDQKFLEEFQIYLNSILTKHRPTDIVHIAVCLRRTCTLAKNPEKILTYLLNLFKQLDGIKRLINNSSTLDKASLTKYKIVIRIVSNLTRYCPLEKDLEEKLMKSYGNKFPSLTELTVCGYILPFTQANLDKTIRNIAIRNIAMIVVGEPGVFTKLPAIKKLFDGIMNSSKGNYIEKEDFFSNNEKDLCLYRDEKLLVLKMIDELLQLEEENANLKLIAKRENEQKEIDSDSLQGKAQNTFTDSGTSSIIQAYLDPILNCCLSEDDEFSKWASLALSASIRQNFADPNRSMKVIIALEGSKLTGTVSAAKAAHERMHEKYQTRLEQTYSEGIKLACKCYTNIPSRFNGRFNGSGPFNIIWGIIKDSKSSRKKLLVSLMKKISIQWEKYGNEDDLSHIQENINYACFISYGLSDLNVTDLNDILTIILEINQILSTSGLDFVHAITTVYDSKLELGEEKWNCFGAAAQLILILIQFRNFLKLAYDISDKYIRDYTERKKIREIKAEKGEDYRFDIENMMTKKRNFNEIIISILKCFDEVEGSDSTDVTDWLKQKLDDENREQLVKNLNSSPTKLSPAKRKRSKVVEVIEMEEEEENDDYVPMDDENITKKIRY